MLSIAFAANQPAAGSAVNPPLFANIIPLVLIFGIFYFLLIRPQQQKQKEHVKMLSAIKKNDEIVTAGGIHGTVVNVKDTTVTLKVDENVKVEVEKTHISCITKQQ